MQAGQCLHPGNHGAVRAQQAGQPRRSMHSTACCAARARTRPRGAAPNACHAPMAHTPTPGDPRTATTASSAPMRLGRYGATSIKSLLVMVVDSTWFNDQRGCCAASLLFLTVRIGWKPPVEHHMREGPTMFQCTSHAYTVDLVLNG